MYLFSASDCASDEGRAASSTEIEARIIRSAGTPPGFGLNPWALNNNKMVTIQHPRLGMLCIPRCGAVRGAARLVVLNNYIK